MGAHEPAEGTMGKQLPAWKTWGAGPIVVCIVAYTLALVAGWVTLILLPPDPTAWGAIWRILVADIVATFVIFAASRLVDNSSVYDPYWSVVPPVLMIYWMSLPASGEGITLREGIVFALVTLWAVRLTWNCFQRWKDLTGEDFRYVDLREKSGKLYPLVDLFGIQLMPTALVFLASLPLWAVTRSDAPLGILDFIAFAITFGAIAIEAISDEQLKAFVRDNETPGRVCDRGLWRWSQHPNYFGEVAFWWGLFGFALAASLSNSWMIIGAIAMTILFWFASIPMMLERKRRRKPDYDDQVKGVSVFILMPPRDG